MKIKTITCHDVYNVGASLQAYALQKYLMSQGHDVEIIDYKPDYLSKHYSLLSVDNPKYNRRFVKQAYLLAKLPKRLIAKMSKRKRNFDEFRSKYLRLTSRRYHSNEMLKENLPDGDLYIAGSDQIWNPLFQNGKDPAFFLDFVPDNKKKISYAASFAVDGISETDNTRMYPMLKRLDAISVREKSGIAILEEMGIESAEAVCDPVFLLSAESWKKLIQEGRDSKYLFLYDFDGTRQTEEFVKRIADENNLKIYSFFPSKIADKYLKDLGPIEFLNMIQNAECIVSNSFHATVFSIILHKDFYVVNRQEKINTRMADLLKSLGIESRMMHEGTCLGDEIPWNQVDDKLENMIATSKDFLERNCKE